MNERLEKTLAALEKYLFQVRLEGDDAKAVEALQNVRDTCVLELTCYDAELPASDDVKGIMKP